ncbi:MAG: hypothetical protein JKY50_04960 [Oleispira sp.]|nr:hypothetical protein [Oleispira sp.]
MIIVDSTNSVIYSLVDYSQYIARLETNLDVSAVAVVDCYDPAGSFLLFSAIKLSGAAEVRFKKSDLYNVPIKLVARLLNVPGVYWNDSFIFQDGVINIEFKSQGESVGSGELKAFNGSLTQDGQPVSRAVYALAIDGDSPKLLASAISDAQGDYVLQWNDYVGQILITASDDYGDLFLPGAMLSVGARIHPLAPTGYVYEASSAGALGSVAPVWPVIAGEAVTSGEVQLTTKPFYRPKSAGPFTIN